VGSLVEAVVVVTQNTYNIWQTILAVVMLVGAGASGIGWLSRRIPKSGDLKALREALQEVQNTNTKENSRIMDMIREVKSDLKQTTMRLERHIDKVSANPAEDGDE